MSKRKLYNKIRARKLKGCCKHYQVRNFIKGFKQGIELKDYKTFVLDSLIYAEEVLNG